MYAAQQKKRLSTPGLVPLRHGGTQNCRRAVSPVVRLVEVEESTNPHSAKNEDGNGSNSFLANNCAAMSPSRQTAHSVVNPGRSQSPS
ncbi:hypothetical protein TNCV_3744171 [Trichonephila clavipes]|nr:hypothetical protein TNCV_3744171 [Trichonephila clavipes]